MSVTGELGYKKLKYLKRVIEQNSKRRPGRLSKAGNKLPKVDYGLPLKDFITIIKVYPNKVKTALLQQWHKVTKSRKRITELQEEEGKHNYGKLTPIQRAEVIELFSRFYTVGEIRKIIIEEWGVKSYSITSLLKLKEKWLEEIKRRRNLYINDISKLRLVHKRARVEEYMELYELVKQEKKYGYQIKVLDSIKGEVERNQLDVIVSGEVNINKSEKIGLDIGFDNIKALAFFRVSAMLPLEARQRINTKLFQNAGVTPMLLPESTQDKYKGSHDIEDADYTVVEDTPEAKQKKDHIKEKKKEANDFISKSKEHNKTKGKKSLREIMLKKMKKRMNKLDKIKTDVDKIDIKKRGEEL